MLGWNVIDTYPLNEWEHGLAIEGMHQSDVSAYHVPMLCCFLILHVFYVQNYYNLIINPSSYYKRSYPRSQRTQTAETGIVDRDGEDVSSCGHIFLFEIYETTTSLDDTGASTANPKIAKINFVYERRYSLDP